MRKLNSYGPSLIVLGTALLVLLAGPSAVWRLTYARTNARIVQASERLESNSILEQLNQAYRDLATFVEPSVVHISTERTARDQRGNERIIGSSGSGWIYDDKGHIVTNFHVIEQADRIQVQLHSGEIREAQPTGSDQFTDIAVIKIAPGLLQPAVRATAEDHVQQGDLVFAFGSPFDFRFSLSSGVVSGMGRSVGVIRDTRGRWTGYENFIQVDAAINPGNSGGPLTDARGRVIGMNTAIATGPRASVDEGQFAGIGLAIPLDMIEPVADQLIETRIVQKGFLGVRVDDLSPAAAQELRRRGFIGQGVRVAGVDLGGPALEAGVQPDDVVTHVNDESVGSVAQLRSVISSMLPGEIAHLRVWRYDPQLEQGRLQTIPVDLTRLDTARLAGIVPPDYPRDRLEIFGIADMATSTPALAARYDVSFHAGVLIKELTPGSQLDGRVEPGSIIVAFMGNPVTDVDDLFDQLGNFNLRRRFGVQMTMLLPDGTRADPVLRVR
ncbi:MAG: trypsin-like peptidase domain-containing protein [Planctomycetota bacterium]|jgi:serine protease Do